jgi:AcrR family transcriptional regulator
MSNADEGDLRQTRRRGAELEDAILDAAWAQLVAEGYEHFTMETVAARAGASKPVLYRRWKTRDDLLRAAVRRQGDESARPIPDTGTLRGDVLALLTEANTEQNRMAALISSMLGSYYNGTGLSPSELRLEYRGDRGHAMEIVVDRAIERGEADASRVTPRILDLPFGLYRNERILTLQLVPDHVLRQIVDDIFLPLVAVRAT